MEVDDGPTARYEKGVKKYFTSFSQKDSKGVRIMDEQSMFDFLDSVGLIPNLLTDEEVLQELQSCCKNPDVGLTWQEFKKYLKKLAVVEFKKKKYDNRFPSYEQRYVALFDFIRADDDKA
eukprot:CAMPEP_0113674734 /NCGR_PEP_ID=MMETSP0038_2-20120614/7602_1 /TAXON_ID=2898 /ORGANISM="Cryptomonas paramecium" /LENGTH=119 /DNA_ID=CAMNT_0000591385 /DNA_START=84 /DNA_END=440 /DNA_ORIENTATION=+ /assembly_acc=CAM_ASM_000170